MIKIFHLCIGHDNMLVEGLQPDVSSLSSIHIKDLVFPFVLIYCDCGKKLSSQLYSSKVDNLFSLKQLDISKRIVSGLFHR